MPLVGLEIKYISSSGLHQWSLLFSRTSGSFCVAVLETLKVFQPHLSEATLRNVAEDTRFAISTLYAFNLDDVGGGAVLDCMGFQV